jgi:DNA-binding CsgD family transcriptional regulator/tetratricopeptide (TPR) repeat protein
VLIGRAAEWAAVEARLTRAGDSEGGVLLLRGEAGVGKSALLEEAAGAPGFRVLAVTGVQTESELPYATAHQLLEPLLPLLDRLPTEQADAVRTALGLGQDGGEPDRFLVALGFLSLVSEAAREQPLLLLVDDVQWCDRASVDAIFFLARRLSAEPVAMLLAVREGLAAELTGPLDGTPGLAELRVDGLATRAVAELVAMVGGVRPTQHVVARLAAATRGNPLAVRELARVLSRDQLAGARALPADLPVGARLERAFLARAVDLSAEARDLLLLASVEESGELDLLMAALGLDEPAVTVEEVEGTGLVTVRDGRLVFSHPLARAALLGDATTDQRVDAHRRLAQALATRGERDRSLWHRAAGTTGPDVEIAAALDAMAARSRGRSGHAAAAAALERAADLSATSGPRTRRLLDAADAAWLAGETGRAWGLVDRAQALAVEPADRARVLELRARAASRRGDVRSAHPLLLEAAGLLREQQPAAALELCAEAVEGAAYAGDVERLREAVTAAAGIDAGASPREQFLATWLGVGNATLRSSLDRDARLLERVLALGEQLDEPRLVVWAGIAAFELGDVSGMQHFYRRALDLARSSGAAGALPYALEHSAMSLALAGGYAAARSAVEEGLRLAVETEQQRSASQLLAILAFIAATTGDEQATTYADRAREIAVPLGLGLPTAMALWATARTDLTSGRYDAAVDRLLTLAGSRSDVGHPVVTLWTTPDLVEAAVRAGRQDEVTTPLDRLVRLAEAGRQPVASAAAGWCRGLLGGPGATDQLRGAADAFHTLRLPLAEGRARLALGETLRRDRQPGSAREHLRVAAEMLDRVGARPWAERAVAELRASGEAAAPARGPDGLERLTPQELQIVRYVAQGAPDREIAAQLFMSPRTVEHHLDEAYPKLGISARTELVGVLRGAGTLASSG